MPPQFLGNPLDCDEFWDNDLEPNADEEWIRLPHDTVVMELRNPLNITIDITQSDDDTVWLDEDDDFVAGDDYNNDPDYNLEENDEVFEETDMDDDLEEMLDESDSQGIYDFYRTYGVDEDDYECFDDFHDDDDEDDYVTYEDTCPNPSTHDVDNSAKSTADSNFDNLTTDTDTD